MLSSLPAIDAKDMVNGHQQDLRRRRSWLSRRRAFGCFSPHEHKNGEIFADPVGTKRGKILKFFRLDSRREAKNIQVSSIPENGSKSQCSTATPFPPPPQDDDGFIHDIPLMTQYSLPSDRMSALEEDDTDNTMDEEFGPPDEHISQRSACIKLINAGVQCEDAEWWRQVDEIEQAHRILLSQLCDKLYIDARQRPQSLEQSNEQAAGSFEAQKRILLYQRDFLDLMHQAAKRISGTDQSTYEDARSSWNDPAAYHDVMEDDSVSPPAGGEGILNLSLPLEMNRSRLRSDTPIFDPDMDERSESQEEDCEPVSNTRHRMDTEDEEEPDAAILCPHSCASMEPESTMLYLIQNEGHRKAQQEVTFVVPADLTPGTDVRFTHNGTTYRVSLGPDHLPGTTVHVRVGKPPPLSSRERKEIHDFVRIGGEVMQMAADGTENFLQNKVSRKRLRAYRAIQGQNMQPLMDDVVEEEAEGSWSDGDPLKMGEKATGIDSASSEELSGSELSTNSLSNGHSTNSSRSTSSNPLRGPTEQCGTPALETWRDPSSSSSSFIESNKQQQFAHTNNSTGARPMNSDDADSATDEHEVFMPPPLPYYDEYEAQHQEEEQQQPFSRYEREDNQDIDSQIRLPHSLADYNNFLDLSLPSKGSSGSSNKENDVDVNRDETVELGNEYGHDGFVSLGMCSLTSSSYPSSYPASSFILDTVPRPTCPVVSDKPMGVSMRERRGWCEGERQEKEANLNEEDMDMMESCPTSCVESSPSGTTSSSCLTPEKVPAFAPNKNRVRSSALGMKRKDCDNNSQQDCQEEARDTLGPLLLTRKHSNNSSASSVMSSSSSRRSSNRSTTTGQGVLNRNPKKTLSRSLKSSATSSIVSNSSCCSRESEGSCKWRCFTR